MLLRRKRVPRLSIQMVQYDAAVVARPMVKNAAAKERMAILPRSWWLILIRSNRNGIIDGPCFASLWPRPGGWIGRPEMWAVLSQTFREFVDDECPRLAAALAYYTFFSLPALLVVIVYVGGLLVDRAAVADRLKSHFEETIGRTGAEQMTAILQNASRPEHSLRGWIVGTAMLVLGATGALQELQTALNWAWGVGPDPKQGGLRTFFTKRLISLTLLLGIGLLLTASLAVSWGLAAFGHGSTLIPASALQPCDRVDAYLAVAGDHYAAVCMPSSNSCPTPRSIGPMSGWARWLPRGCFGWDNGSSGSISPGRIRRSA